MNCSYNARPIPRPSQTQRDNRLPLYFLFIPLILIAAYVVYALGRPLPAPKTTVIPPVIPAQVAVNIPWPATGESAFGASGYGLLAVHNEQKPVPTASVAKVITALAILDKKPLVPSEQGPSLTMTAKDVALYDSYATQDGSVVPVFEGQTISEYQALQAMMLPSANNIADTAAVWAFGSLEAYRTYATGLVHRLGMDKTSIGSDASGFSPSTTSTASDLVRLGDAALKNPVLSEIVNQKEATFPDYGTIDNVNTLLGQAGIRGIKTGNTDEAGGCLLAAADVTISGQKVTVITAIMDAPNLSRSMRDTLPMVQSAVSQFRLVHIVSHGQSVGQVSTVWGSSTPITADSSIDVLAWNGTALSPHVHDAAVPLAAASHAPAGSLDLAYNGHDYTTALHTTGVLQKPSLMWRLRHPW